MKTLKERLKDRAKEYRRLITTEREAERLLEYFPNKEAVAISVYSDIVNFHLITDLETAELDLIPRLSKDFGSKWTKEVNSNKITYQLSALIRKVFVTVVIHVYLGEACHIVAVPTGKTKKVFKTVEVEEPEMEFQVNCVEE